MQGRRSGLAAVEFAMLAPALLLLVTCALDFGEAFYLQLQVATGLNAAAQYAFLNAQLVYPSTVTSFLSNVQTIATSAAKLTTTPTVTALFNDSATSANGGNNYCLSGSPTVTWTSTGSSTTSCGSSVMSGKFVTITITASEATFFLSDPLLGGSISVSDTAIVRFQ